VLFRSPSIEEAGEALAELNFLKRDMALVYDIFSGAFVEIMGNTEQLELGDGVSIEKKSSYDRKGWKHSDIASVVASKIVQMSVDMDTGEVTKSPTEIAEELNFSYSESSFEKDESGFFANTPMSPQEHRDRFISFCSGWKLFEKFCETNNIKLIWGSWDYPENKNYELFSFSKSYINLSNEGLMGYIEEVRPEGILNQYDIERRDGHLGILHHEYWHKEILNSIKEKGWLN
jgi:hypothetical protein